MANTFAPNGFQQYQGTGSSPTYEQTQLAIASTNTAPIFFGDPVTQAANSTGVGTGYIVQGYGTVTVTVAATGIASTAAGAMTITYTAASGVSTTANLPTGWVPPIGSTVVVSNATGVPNGVFSVTGATTTTIAVQGPYTVGIATSSSTTPSVTVYVPIAGIFVGCRYLSTANKYPVWRNYWPGSDANGDVQAFVITDPNAQFSVMTGNQSTNASAVGFSNIGQNIGFAWSQSGLTSTNGVTANGLSTMFADQGSLITAGATAMGNALLPFRIIALQNYVPGAVSPLVSINGNDNTTAYNRVVVAFNNSMPRQFAGI
jgi:hypothetical protein